MGRLLGRILGVALIVAGVAGLAFSVAGLVVLAQIEQQTVDGIVQQVDVVHRALTATGDGLTLAGDSLADAVDAVDSLAGTLAHVGESVDDSVPMVEGVANLVSVQLPESISATQTTLLTVSDSARVIESFLSMMTSFPLLTTEPYNPDVSMAEGLEEVAANLEGISVSLVDMEPGLTTTGQNLDVVKEDLAAMAANIDQIGQRLGDAQGILTQYEGVVDDLEGVILSVRDGLPTWVRWLRLGLSLALVWLGIAQVALITQGWEIIGRSRKPKAVEA